MMCVTGRKLDLSHLQGHIRSQRPLPNHRNLALCPAGLAFVAYEVSASLRPGPSRCPGAGQGSQQQPLSGQEAPCHLWKGISISQVFYSQPAHSLE